MPRDRHALRKRGEHPCDHGHDALRIPLQSGRAGGEEGALLQTDHQPLLVQLRAHLILEIILLNVLIELRLCLREVIVLLHIGGIRRICSRGHGCRAHRGRRPHPAEERRAAHIERCRERLRECLHLRCIRLRHREECNEERQKECHEVGIRQEPSLARFLFMGLCMLFTCHISPLPSVPHAPSAG